MKLVLINVRVDDIHHFPISDGEDAEVFRVAVGLFDLVRPVDVIWHPFLRTASNFRTSVLVF